MFSLSDEDAGAATHIVRVEGELDAATHLQLDTLLNELVEHGKIRIVCDLQEATFLDSTALSGLLAAARQLRRPNGMLAVVVGRHAQPRARFDLTGTGEVLNVCDSREEALALVNETRSAQADTVSPLQLRLYVNGRSPNARRAIVSLEELRTQRLPPDADVEVIDIADQPEVAEAQRLLATPALVRSAPPPVRRIIGDLTNHEQVLYALDLVPSREETW